jgi:hypothetical protein
MQPASRWWWRHAARRWLWSSNVCLIASQGACMIIMSNGWDAIYPYHNQIFQFLLVVWGSPSVLAFKI